MEGKFPTTLPRPKTRFSLVLLDEGEIYVDDLAAVYYPPQESAPRRIDAPHRPLALKGRLYVCSRSLLFEPHDAARAIVRLPLRHVDRIGGAPAGDARRLLCAATRVEVRCKADGGKNAPYAVRQWESAQLFELRFAGEDAYAQLLATLATLHRLARDSGSDRFEAEQQAAALVGARAAALRFDPSWLVSLSETPRFDAPADVVQPLVTSPGRLVVTGARVYFTPLFRVGPDPVERRELADVVRAERRRHLLCPRGVEVFFAQGDALFLSLRSAAEREALLAALPTSRPDLAEMTERWRTRALSTFDYLLYLNREAGRSFNDLTQYPVFPWVLADYASEQLDLANPASFRDLSKPIGALNPQRLERFRERYAQMPADDAAQPRFLYGTHYSTPGYVLYYLVRQAPEYQLHLQNGRFDHPDRLFHSVAETWASVLTNAADLKELIPEFYSSSSFLVNSEGLDLGVRTAGGVRQVVGDVVLPPWASGPEDFTAKMREALECDYVSDHIHQWIDLIFGFKQTPPAAIEADNLFYHLTYEGSVDMEAITDPLVRKGYEDQIREFGQTPSQLFTSPHPRRLPPAAAAAARSRPSTPSKSPAASPGVPAKLPTPEPIPLAAVVEAAERQPAMPTDPSAFKPDQSVKLHREQISACCLSADGSTLYTVSQDACLRAYSLSQRRQLRMGSMELALSSCQLASDGRTLVIGSWDNNVYFYNVEFGRVSESFPCHDDAVSCLRIGEDRLLTGSWDASVRLWQLRPGCALNKTPLAILSEGDAAVNCADLFHDIAASGNADGALTIYDVRAPGRHTVVQQAHFEAINGVRISGSDKLLSCSEDGHVRLWDLRRIRESGDGQALAEICTSTGTPKCLVADGSLALVGTSSGSVELWDVAAYTSRGCLTGHSSAQDGEESITSIAVPEQLQTNQPCLPITTVAAGDSAGNVFVWRCSK